MVLAVIKETKAENLAWIVLDSYIRRHGIARTIVSDRGTQFVGGVWKQLCKLLGIERQLSTAYHHQTDGAMERANSTVETYLGIYAQYDYNDWSQLLPLAELAVNARTPVSTEQLPS